MKFKNIVAFWASAFFLASASSVVLAQSTMNMHGSMASGSVMNPSKTIAQNLMNSKDHTILVSLLNKAGLMQTLSGPGAFTVFAPTNQAFSKLPKATLAKLSADKAWLTKVLTYHVISDRLDSKTITAKIKAGNGKTLLKTLEGEQLIASMMGNQLMLVDTKGEMSMVAVPDAYQSNGIVHVVDTVLMP